MPESADRTSAKERAFRGLFLVFVLTFLNLIGIGLTLAALGGLEPWTRWQFVGLFGVIEASAGLSNIFAPNVWHLPAAEMATRRTAVRLAASAMLLPHWGGAARAAAGICLIFVSGFQEGWAIASLQLLVFVPALALLFLALSAVIARAGVAFPSTDTVQFIIRWRGKENEMEPISLSASVQQFLLGILTIPAVKTLAPGSLFGPEIRPSIEALVITLALAALSIIATALLWAGRLQWRAPREQQREAELKA